MALQDWRNAGLNPVVSYYSRDKLNDWWAGTERRYRSHTEGQIEIVEEFLMKDGRCDYHCAYWIDPSKDWSVLRTAAYDKDNVVTETTYDVKLVDGSWLPAVIEARNREGRIIDRIEVLHAEIDRPEHPQELTLADLQMEPGTMIVAQPGAGRSGAWDGRQVISISELNERIANGTAPNSPARIRELRRLQYLAELDPPAEAARAVPAQLARTTPDSALRKIESEWERYVREFIAKYALTDEQAEKCRGILRACQKQANEYFDRQREEFDKLERELRAAFPPGAPVQPTASAPTNADGSQSNETALLARRAELLAPINDIFENTLKPRLQRIPTRAQRARVDGDATSRPGDGR